jgi:hypothetical protein
MIVFCCQIHVENTGRCHYTACFSVVWVFDLVMFSFSVFFYVTCIQNYDPITLFGFCWTTTQICVYIYIYGRPNPQLNMESDTR